MSFLSDTFNVSTPASCQFRMTCRRLHYASLLIARFRWASRLKASLATLVLVLLFASGAFAQQREFHPEWLAKDVEAIGLILPSLLPIDSKTPAEIKAIFPANRHDEAEDLGFGARKLTFSKPSGYTNLTVNLFTLNGAIQNFSIKIGGSSESWPLIKSQLIDAWRTSGGPEFEEDDSSLFYRKSFDPNLEGYKKSVSAELGEMRAVQVSAALKDSYEYLISPWQNSVVGRGGCGYAGVTPAGREAIDALLKANRVDLLENVLKGFNPGGRVYAAEALLGLKARGLPLSDEAQITINKISGLDIKIMTCSGCFYSARTAKEILESPEQP